MQPQEGREGGRVRLDGGGRSLQGEDVKRRETKEGGRGRKEV